MRAFHLRSAIAVALIAAAPARPAAAQSLVGYSAGSAARERQAESDAIGRPRPASAEAHSRALSAETHVAGTVAQARTRDYVIARMKEWGLETDVRAYEVWMPHAVSVRVARVSPSPKELALAEPPVAGDPTSAMAQYPTVN